VRLLFDENLSHRLVRELADVYPDSAHVRDIGLQGAEDRRIWDYAAERGLLLTSKNTDFYQRSLVFGAPPKVIWQRIGNAPTLAIAELLRQQHTVIRTFYEDSEAKFLPLGVD
jgi:predicted nuclease of predicted toxin-antitoxin system